MKYSKLHALAVLIVVVMASPSFAQSEWIRPGSFMDWPESLKDNGKFELNSRSESEVVSRKRSPIAVQETAFIDEMEPVVQVPTRTVTQTLPVHQQYTSRGWQIFPEGLLFKSYLAGEKEPRFASQWLSEKDRGLIWETAMGGRWGVVRNGTYGTNAEGFQFDIEGAGLARVDPEEESDLEAADFRLGFVATWRDGPYRVKTGYYHISSHVGDEYLIKNPTYVRHNYVRDAVLIALMYDVTPDLAVYGELAWALNANGGADPGELQFGIEYSPKREVWLKGAPFAAINGHLREEYGFGGSVNIIAGWQWIGVESNHSFRAGFQHYNGPSIQYSFIDRHEALTGFGIWFDF